MKFFTLLLRVLTVSYAVSNFTTTGLFDVCENEAGERLYLIGFGFMPAQECHIEKAPADLGKEGWFTLGGYRQYLKQHLDFGKPELRSFAPVK